VLPFKIVTKLCTRFYFIENLKTINRVIHAFKAACFALGLLENDKQWKKALMNATILESPSKLRELFVKMTLLEKFFKKPHSLCGMSVQ
jgi:hypothetical protein